MKKIILVVFVLLLSGCYDYNELTDLGIVSSMFVDFNDNEYTVNLEMLYANKNITDPSYFISGNGDSFESALQDIYNKTNVYVYLHHMDTVIVSESVAKNKMKNIYDYFLRDPDIRKDSYFVMCKNTDNFVNFKTVDKTSLGESIKNIIKYSEKEKGNYKTSLFSNILNSYLNKETYFLGEIAIEKDRIVLKDSYIVKNDKLDFNVDKNAIIVANMLENNPISFTINELDNYDVYDYKVSKNIDKSSINLNAKVSLRLISMNEDKTKTAKDIKSQENKIAEYIRKMIEDSIDYSIINDVDIFNFNGFYCKYYVNNCVNNVWKNVKYNVQVEVMLNERGLILDTLKRKVDNE